MAEGITYEKMVEGLRVMTENEQPPEKHSNEGLMQRIVFCAGDVIAIVRCYGYVYCVDEGYLLRYKQLTRREYDADMWEYTDGQLREQGVM